ncbi:HhH-GPD domain-containing protein [Cephalotus follicularis]|uniref:HhH-GPD domain-containing protein n=1 Tax=Cephalotus follicularis TaxID=3775 RepID=A0A1Q3AWU4_CEPFO|nr:HhH-GPD domain-containing protein [Cephalotus follicularis]
MENPTRVQTRSQTLKPDPNIPPPPPPPTITTTSSKIPFRPKKRLKLTTIAKPLSSKPEMDLALHHLSTTDPRLATLVATYDPPSFPSSPPPFPSLARSILYQQLATKAATSIYTRFLSLCGGESQVLPATLLSLSPQRLREIGVSARKASYLHDLAQKYVDGTLSDDSILEMDDERLLTMLTLVKGIGAWSVHMFMIFSLHRLDVLPVGDLGVRKGVQLLYGLKDLPKPVEMEQLCDKWRPYRSEFPLWP